MATFKNERNQGITEISTYTIDYTDDLPTGGTVTGGTAIHTPPSGSALTPTVAVTSPYVFVTLPALGLVGIHYLDVLATFSDGDKSGVRLAINGVYSTPTARSGMGDIISQLRAMCGAGVNDYVIAGNPYWSDAQLQTILDKHRFDGYSQEILPVMEMSTGVLSTTRYYIGNHNIESGTGVFWIADSVGNTVSTASYSVDYNLGLVTFTANTAGLAYFATYHSFDINSAASEVWRQKASHYADQVTFKAGNQSVNLSDKLAQALQMASYYAMQSGARSISFERSDTC